MEPLLLNSEFEVIRVLDNYDEVIWVERFFEHGDFEMSFKSESIMSDDFVKGNYLQLPDSDELMIIENIEVSNDESEGRTLKISGRALTKILEQRVITSPRILTWSPLDSCEYILNDHFISPTDFARTFENLYFDPYTIILDHGDVFKTIEKVKVYTALREFMTPEGLGFRIRFKEPNEFHFMIEEGVDHSYRQNDNPHIVFSPEFDNLDSTNFFQSIVEYANVAIIPYKDAGDVDRFMTTFRDDLETYGIDRYEILTDLDNQGGNDGPPTQAEFDTASRKAYSENNIKLVYDGEADISTTLVYGEHYNLGDIIQVDDPSTFVGPARIVEYIRSNGGEGYKAYPTFDYIENTD